MDYIPAFEILAVTIAGFILAGTIQGLREGEVHFPVRWLFEAGYKRENPRFRKIVFANFAIAAMLIGISLAHLIEMNWSR